MKLRKRRSGELVPYWFASATAEGRKALERGYPVASANLAELKPSEIGPRCERLQTEMRLWLNGAPRVKPQFNGTFGSLMTIYETDTESTFHGLKPGVQNSYRVYIPRLRAQLGEIRVNDSDGTDVKRWFRKWRVGDDGKDRLPRARFVLAVFKAAVSFGVVRRLDGLLAFKAALEELEFPRPQHRTFAPTAEQIIAARMAAMAAGAPLRALVYSLQFEPTIRQWDIIGTWLPISAPQPSLIHDGKKKWIGPMWPAIDGNGIFRIKPTKTENTTAVDGVYDLTACPMVQEDLARIPIEQRKGPLIIDHETGLPYKYQAFHEAWRKDFKVAGLPPKLWCRDLRAGGVTEGGKSGASKDDRRKLATHADEQTTEIYDRDMLEAGRRVMTSRVNYRNKQ